MICTRESGHDGPCAEGSRSGGCKKTAAKWFEGPDLRAHPITGEEMRLLTEPAGIEGISSEEMAGLNEQRLAMLYRRHMHPASRREAVEWARNVVRSRDLAAGA